jgi:hypothetical protein
MKELIAEIEKSLEEITAYRIQNNLSGQEWSSSILERSLFALKHNLEVQKEFDAKILMAMKDAYIVSSRNFEGTKLHEIMNGIDDRLSKLHSSYRSLKPLGLEFDKFIP